MQIFVTDSDPYKAVKWLDNKRLRKMCCETVQILSHIFNGPHKLANSNHPCIKWAKKNLENCIWLFKYLLALDFEYNLRFNKAHASIMKLFSHLRSKHRYLNMFSLLCEVSDIPEFVNVTDYENIDVIHAYRLTLINKWHTDKRKLQKSDLINIKDLISDMHVKSLCDRVIKDKLNMLINIYSEN